MNRDIIAVLINIFYIHGMDDAAIQAPSRFNRDIRVVTHNVHTQMHGGIGYHSADGAQTDDAQGLARQLRAGKSALALFDQLGNARLAIQGLGPLDTAHHVTGGEEQAGQHQFLYGVGIGTGSVEDNDTFLGAIVHRDVVNTGAGTGDGQ